MTVEEAGLLAVMRADRRVLEDRRIAQHSIDRKAEVVEPQSRVVLRLRREEDIVAGIRAMVADKKSNNQISVALRLGRQRVPELRKKYNI